MTFRSNTVKAVLFTFIALVCLVPASARSAAAAECGDDVAGERVACSCGDIVASDTVLSADDPVVSNRCDHDALIVRAPRGAASIVLDLAGLSIVGSGSGVGIRILDGGDDGAVIVGGEPGRAGEIANFRNGVRATGSHALQEIRDVTIKGSAVDGLVVRGADASVVRVTVEDSGRDGMRVGGSDHRLEGVESTGNARYGVRVTGRDIEGEASAAGNARGALLASPSGTGVKVEDAD